MIYLPVTVTLIAWLTLDVGDIISHLYRPASCMDMFWNIRNNNLWLVMFPHLIIVWLDWYRCLHWFFSSILHHVTFMLFQQCFSLTTVQLIFRVSITRAFHTVFRGTLIDGKQSVLFPKNTIKNINTGNAKVHNSSEFSKINTAPWLSKSHPLESRSTLFYRVSP